MHTRDNSTKHTAWALKGEVALRSRIGSPRTLSDRVYPEIAKEALYLNKICWVLETSYEEKITNYKQENSSDAVEASAYSESKVDNVDSSARANVKDLYDFSYSKRSPCFFCFTSHVIFSLKASCDVLQKVRLYARTTKELRPQICMLEYNVHSED